MELDLDRLRANIRKADTEDLLHRVTVYRAGMEDAAVFLIEQELRTRGVTARDIEDHADRVTPDVIMLPEGYAATCSFCHAPAVERGWGWYRRWGWLPPIPWQYYYCQTHSRKPREEPDEPDGWQDPLAS